MRFSLVLMAIALAAGLVSCEVETLDTKIPKVFLSADSNTIESFFVNYSDSLNPDSKSFGRFLLEEIQISDILRKRSNNRQASYIAKWALNNKESFAIRWKSALYLVLNNPLSHPPGAFQVIESGVSAKADSIRLTSLHIIANYPKSRAKVIERQLFNILENSRSEIPIQLASMLQARYHNRLNLNRVTLKDLPYPGQNIDRLMREEKLANLLKMNLANLYLWKIMSYTDSTFSLRSKWVENFKIAANDIRLMIWKSFIYHKEDPVASLLNSAEIDPIYKAADSPLRNEILTDVLASGKSFIFADIIIKWLQDSTITDYEKRRILNHFPENPPEIYFDALYDACDKQYLQNTALELIAGIQTENIDHVLKKKLDSGENIHKVIYVIGFRKKTKSIDYLEPFLQNENEIIRFNTREAIQRIKGSKKH